MTPVLLQERQATFKRVKVDVNGAVTTLKAMLTAKFCGRDDYDALTFFIEANYPCGLFNYVRTSTGTLWNCLERMYPELWPYFSLDGEKLCGIDYEGNLDRAVIKLYEAGIEAITNCHTHPDRQSFRGFFVKASNEQRARRLLI